MRENTDQKNSQYGHFLQNEIMFLSIFMHLLYHAFWEATADKTFGEADKKFPILSEFAGKILEIS